jgi:hypothetical protein
MLRKAMLRAAAIGLVAFALSNSAFSDPIKSETVKLSCHFTETKTYSSGKEEKSRGRIVLEVETEGAATFISGTSGDLSISVTNLKSRMIVDVRDFSDEGKWDISTQSTSTDQSLWLTQIRIDRNTGDFNFLMSKSGGISIGATGTCEKVNPSQRKF